MTKDWDNPRTEPDATAEQEQAIRRTLRAIAGNAVDAAKALRGRTHRTVHDDDTSDAILELLMGVGAEDPNAWLLATPQLQRDSGPNYPALIAKEVAKAVEEEKRRRAPFSFSTPPRAKAIDEVIPPLPRVVTGAPTTAGDPLAGLPTTLISNGKEAA